MLSNEDYASSVQFGFEPRQVKILVEGHGGEGDSGLAVSRNILGRKDTKLMAVKNAA